MEKALSDYEIAKKLMTYTGKVAWPTIVLFLVCIVAYGLVIWAGVTDVLPLWAGLLLNVLFAYLLFTPLHEAGHRNISGKKISFRPWESLIGWMSGMVILAPFPLFRMLHNEHHKHTNHPEDDPDYWVASQSVFSLIFKCATIYFKYIAQYSQKASGWWQSNNNRKDMIANIAFMILGYTGLTLWMVYGQWQDAVFLVILPAHIALGLLAFAFDWLPHHPHAVQQRFLDTRIIVNPLLTIILVSQNLHLIHHLYSGVPFYHYGNALKVMRGRLEKEGSRIDE